MKIVVLYLILSLSDGGVSYQEYARYADPAQCEAAGEQRLLDDHFVKGYICSGARVVAKHRD